MNLQENSSSDAHTTHCRATLDAALGHATPLCFLHATCQVPLLNMFPTVPRGLPGSPSLPGLPLPPRCGSCRRRIQAGCYLGPSLEKSHFAAQKLRESRRTQVQTFSLKPLRGCEVLLCSQPFRSTTVSSPGLGQFYTARGPRLLAV